MKELNRIVDILQIKFVAATPKFNFCMVSIVKADVHFRGCWKGFLR
jgi:hypothetical protein